MLHLCRYFFLSSSQKQTDIFFNRCNKRMSRNVRRPLVVQRTLLPKTQVPTRQIMTLTLLPDVPQLAQKGSFMPVVSQPLPVPVSSHPPAGYLQPGTSPSIAKILPFHVSTGKLMCTIVSRHVFRKVLCCIYLNFSLNWY